MKKKAVSRYENSDSVKGHTNHDASLDETTLYQDDLNLKEVSYRNYWNKAVGKKLSLWQKFSNLPISSKQLIALIASEMVGVLGIGIVGMFLITNKLQSLSLEQAKSEVAVTDIAYNIKIDQMGFGFRGQSDNTALIKAAKLHASNQLLDPDLKRQVKQILQNEVRARKIEYATLVGKDLKIIVNANLNRQGEIWNPNNLIREVLRDSRQIKASRIVSWSDIQRESPPLPEDFRNQNALIRYTVTPVKDPVSNVTIGALVSGDIVNGKPTIVKETIESTGGGYSAIYMRQPKGEYSLVTSLKLNDSKDIADAVLNIDIPEKGKLLLQQAAASKGKPITGRLKIGDRTYAMAFKAIPSKIYDAYDAPVYDPKKGRFNIFNQNPTAILVRGTPETALNQLLQESFWVEIITIAFAWGIMLFWAFILRKSIIKPIEHLGNTARKFAGGDRTARAEIFAIDEVGQLAASFNQMADRISHQSLGEVYKGKMIEIVQKISSLCCSPFNLNQILHAAVINIRETIKADRVIVYRLKNDWRGKIIAESVGNEWSKTLGTEVEDPNFAQYYLQNHPVDSPLAIENIYLTNLSKPQIAQLSEFAIKALLVVPILIDNKLYGFLIAQQCSESRKWEEAEINLLKQVTIPLGYALEKASLMEELDNHRNSNLANNQQREQLRQLLEDMKDVSAGDLTVQAKVTGGEVGVIAQYFNSVVADLRDMVSLLKISLQEVKKGINTNQHSTNLFSGNINTFIQIEEIDRTSDKIEPIIPSSIKIIDNAQKAFQIVAYTSEIAQKSAIAINTTAQGIFNLCSSFTQTGQKIERLRDTTADMFNVVNSIKQIATQTHLLAINIGLEVSRNIYDTEDNLGANTELGELALRCTNATQEIEEYLKSIQDRTKDVVKEIKQQTHEALEIKQLADTSQVSLDQIHNLSEELADLVNSISQTSEFQLETFQTEEKLISDISHTKQLSAQHSQQIAQTLLQTLKVFQQLEDTVGKFKIE
ncbi:MAG: HAMP domain-containing protein [Cyanobacteria bacterium P01_A01_bin.84]